jgi:hypothetical protein
VTKPSLQDNWVGPLKICTYAKAQGRWTCSSGHDVRVDSNLKNDIRSTQLVRARDVAKKLGVSISRVIQHASGKRKPYLPAVKMGPGRSPLRFDPNDVEKFIDDCRYLAGQQAKK